MIAVAVAVIWAARWGHKLAARTKRHWLRTGIHLVATGVTGTIAVLRTRSWRVLGTWVDLIGSIGALWACLIAVNEHLPFAVVCMGYLIGQFAQAIPIPGGIGAIDAGVTGALVLYGGGASTSTAGELLSRALAIFIALAVGLVAFALLPGEINRVRRSARVSPSEATAAASATGAG
jgi:uncharacterized membrane protein YbhN (UPF0104 family)